MPAVVLTTSLPAHATSTNSALTVDIASATITAGASSNVTATVKDSQGRPWAGQLVTLSLSGPSGSSLGTTTGTTNSAGQVTTTLSTDAFTANGATLTVTATSGPLTNTDTATITGGVNLTVSTAPQITAGAANSVTATLQNASGTAISGKTVTFSVTGIDGTFNATTGTTNGSGQVAVNLTPNTWTKPGATPTITATTGPATATTSTQVLGANALVAGYNNTYQLGVGDTSNRSTLTQPLRVFPSPIVQIVSGGLWTGTPGYYTLFLLENGTVWSVGKNSNGQLGLSNTTDQPTPTMISWFVTNGIKIKQVAAGGDTGYALTTGGDVYAWGEGSGIDANASSNRSTPTKINGLGTGVQAIAAGADTGYALTSSNGVKAWGGGGAVGALGNNSTSNSSTPVDVSGLGSGVRSIAANEQTGYALLLSGEVRAWGAGGSGQLGNQSNNNSLIPVTVRGLVAGSKTTQIAAAFRTAYALVDGSVRAWGANDSTESGTRHYGMVGNNSSTNINEPVTVIASGAKNIGASSRNAYVEMDDGTFRSWSYNADGQLGNGTATGEPWTPATANGTLGSTGRKVTALENYSYSSLISAYVTDYITVP